MPLTKEQRLLVEENYEVIGRINLKKLKSWMIPIACGILTVCLFKFVLFIGYVPSASMEPTVKRNSYVFGLRLHGELKRGDIVFFTRDGKTYLKRIAAIPGDTVYIDDTDHSVAINTKLETVTRTIMVPGDCFFMLGDNEDDSFDSRYWEDPFIDEDEILACIV